MRRTILPAICILLCTLFISVIPTEAEAAIYDDTVRLHILAASDSAEDQKMKINLRDKLLEKYSSSISPSSGADDAKAALSALLPQMKKDCEAWLLDTGYAHSVDITLCEEWYNTREYEDFTLPAGIYSSLKIVIGEGEGQNWWCVMYPPLCLDAALSSENESFSSEEYSLISKDGYNVKFKLLEVSSAIFSGKNKR